MNNSPPKPRFLLPILLALLAIIYSLLFISCDWEAWEAGNVFASDLQGTWVTHDSDERYSGSLVISSNTITITGYGVSQTPFWGGNDEERPFKNFTKGAPLKGYSVRLSSTTSAWHGEIFIEDTGILQTGIPYRYWHTTSPVTQTRIEFLTFEFDGRLETLRKE